MADIIDGKSNTITTGETTSSRSRQNPGSEPGQIADGTSNTIAMQESLEAGLPLPVFVQNLLRDEVDRFYLTRVRIHTKHRFRHSILGGGALAYVRGRHIYFAPGKYNPHTPSGFALLARVLKYGAAQRSLWLRFRFGFWTKKAIGI